MKKEKNILRDLKIVFTCIQLGQAMFMHPGSLDMKWKEISDNEIEFHYKIPPQHQTFHIGFSKDSSSLVTICAYFI